MKKPRTTMYPRIGRPGVSDGYYVNLNEVQRIQENCDPFREPLAVFYALNIIASEKKSERFLVANRYISKLSGLSRNRVEKALQELARINVIRRDVVPRPAGIANTVTTIMGDVRLS